MTFDPTLATDPAPPDGDPESEIVTAEPAEPVKQAHPVRNITEWLAIIGAALLVAFVIKTYLIQAFYIPSGSMENTLNIRDRVLVNKVSYHLHDIHRGDIVVFKRPPNEGGGPEIKDLIKRVIGLPNETIESKDGRIYIDDKLVDEPYLHGVTMFTPVQRQVIPADHYFVMGDNRNNSKDSRVFGPIAGKLIIGRAFIRIWPITRLHLL